MTQWIIDDFGEIYRSGSATLTQTLGFTTGGPQIENYAIENMGHVGIAERAGKAHIRCRPEIMADKAISAMLYWLLDCKGKQIVVSWLDDVWHMERAMPCRLAITFLCHLMDKRTLPTVAPERRLLSRASQATKLRWSATAKEALPTLLDTSASETRRRALDATYNGRWTVVALNLRSLQIRAVEIGGGYPPLDPDLMNDNGKYDFGTLGDRAYRDWILSNFADVAVHRRPKFEDVDAVVSWPRTGDMRTRYWRAVVPLKYEGNSCQLLSVSGGDSSIDLRPNLVQVNG